jgi:uncharacterized protein YjbI with pentapeptide repeats
MKRLSLSVSVVLTAVFVIAPLVLMSTSAYAQSMPPNAATPTPEELQLIKARSANEEAQTEYYRVQTAKLLEKSPPTSFWQKIVDNPASVLGVLGAVIAALVALVSFAFNYRATLQNQRDTQFYEALKRFGDKDSPTIRCIAAGILAQIGQRKVREFKWTLRKAPQFENQWPYFETVLDQLIAGLLLEENQIVLDSTRYALQQLIPIAPRCVVEKLYQANLQLQDAMIVALANFAATLGVALSADEEFWKLCESLTDYEHTVLRELVELSEGSLGKVRFKKLLETASLARRSKEKLANVHGVTSEPSEEAREQERQADQVSTQNALRLAASRLRRNVEVCSVALRSSSFSYRASPFEEVRFRLYQHGRTPLGERHGERPVPPLLALRRVFLAGANLSSTQLIGIDLTGAQLQNTELSQAHLQAARLIAARLQGARGSWVQLQEASLIGTKLQGARLEDARLQGARLDRTELQGASLENAQLEGAKLERVYIDEATKLQGANWWAADFSKDPDLLKSIDERYGDSVPDDLSQVHQSVRTFIETKRSSEMRS